MALQIDQQVKCDLCPNLFYGYNCLAEMMLHKFTIHGDQINTPEQKDDLVKYFCDECSKKFEAYNGLLIHKGKEHRKKHSR